MNKSQKDTGELTNYGSLYTSVLEVAKDETNDLNDAKKKRKALGKKLQVFRTEGQTLKEEAEDIDQKILKNPKDHAARKRAQEIAGELLTLEKLITQLKKELPKGDQAIDEAEEVL